MTTLAYIDTIHAGLVPCKVISITRSTLTPNLNVQVKVTAARRGYDRGEEMTWSGHTVIPREAVYKPRGGYFPKILPYSWQAIATAAGIAITASE